MIYHAREDRISKIATSLSVFTWAEDDRADLRGALHAPEDEEGQDVAGRSADVGSGDSPCNPSLTPNCKSSAYLSW